jgi:hypothetical protein
MPHLLLTSNAGTPLSMVMAKEWRRIHTPMTAQQSFDIHRQRNK